MRVLHFIQGLNVGGAETFIYNIMLNINQENCEFHFLIQDKDSKNKKLIDFCKSKKSNIYIIPPFPRKMFKHCKELNRILKNNEYDVIHIHVNSLINSFPIYIARRHKIRVVVHSHSTKNSSGGLLGRILHLCNRFIVNHLKVVKVACGQEAGKWMYKSDEFTVLNNSISVDDFAFSQISRDIIRERLNVKDSIVIGHVGRFVEAKNHEFLIGVFSKIIEIEPKAKLVLVGEGPLQETIQMKCDLLGIRDKVIFEGRKLNTSEYYSCFDCMVFPSLYEGLPFVLVEAQASGLPIITSDNVTRNVNITDDVHFLSLDESFDRWVNKIMECLAKNKDRKADAIMVEKSIYNVKGTVEKLLELYRT